MVQFAFLSFLLSVLPGSAFRTFLGTGGHSFRETHYFGVGKTSKEVVKLSRKVTEETVNYSPLFSCLV